MNKLKTKLILIVFMILLVTIAINNAINGYFFHHELGKAVEREMIQIGKNVEQQLARILALGINIRDVYEFDVVMQDMISKYPEVSYAFVLDKEGEVLFFEERLPSNQLALNLEQYNKVIIEHTEAVIDMTIGGNSYAAALVPVVNDVDVVQGAVAIAVSHEYIQSKTNKMITGSALQSAGFFLISLLLLGTILTRWVTKPLDKVMEVMHAAGQGNLDARANIQTQNEFAVLGNRLNQMLQQIKELMKSKEHAAQLKMQYVQEQERSRLAERLRHSLYTLNSTLDEERVQMLIIQQIQLFARCERAGLWLYLNDQRLERKARYHAGGTDSQINPERIRDLVEFFANDARAEWHMDQIGQSYIMAIPIHVQGRLTGLIVLERGDTAFERTEADSVLAYTSQASIALTNAMMYRQMETMAVTDELTGLFNRRYFYQLVQQAFEEAKLQERPLSVILLDLDYFKQINDRYGHFVGDEVLRLLASRLQALIPAQSVMARFGGEEFILLVPDTEGAKAMMCAQSIGDAVSGQIFETAKGNVEVTMSVGVTAMRSGDELTRFLQRADEALYEAKENGRNQVVYKP